MTTLAHVAVGDGAHGVAVFGGGGAAMTDFWIGFLCGGGTVIGAGLAFMAWAVLTNDYSK